MAGTRVASTPVTHLLRGSLGDPMATPRFMQHAPFSHRSAYGRYEDEQLKLPRAHNVSWAIGLVMVLVAVMTLIVYYVL